MEKKMKKLIFALVVVIALFPFASIAQLNVNTQIGAKFCDPFDILVIQEKGHTFLYIFFASVILFICSSIIFIVLKLVEKRKEKQALDNNLQQQNNEVLLKVRKWRKFFFWLIIGAICTGVISYSVWYIRQGEYRTRVKSLHEEGCVGY